MSNIIEAFINNQRKHDEENKLSWGQVERDYKRLTFSQTLLADEGINRYLDMCDKHDIAIESAPIREIVMDAGFNRQVWKESDAEFIGSLHIEHTSEFRSRIAL